MAAAASSREAEEWEICNDDGFVYKRRKRTVSYSAAHQPGLPPPDLEAELERNRRARRKLSLMALRDRYREEIEQWEGLDAALQDGGGGGGLLLPTGQQPIQAAAAAAASSSSSSYHQEEEHAPFNPLIEELLLQVEVQEAIIRKLSDLCDVVDSVCDAREETTARSLADLPIWGSPRSLVASLSDIDSDR